MIIIKLMGGLGNQMFQYALGRRLALLNQVDLKLDLTELLDRTPKANVTFRDYELGVFQINSEIAKEKEVRLFYHNDIISKIKRLIISTKLLTEKSLNFDPNILDSGNQVYLSGYWQCEKYFEPIRNVLLSDFTLRQSFLDKLTTDERIRNIKNQIKTTSSVSVHFRRGDYVSDLVTNHFHGTCSMSYYQNAIERIAVEIANPHFFLFTDDPDWVINQKIIESFPTTLVLTSNMHLDMYLMSLCKHNIIANSSFSWWGAWLNQNEKKLVIAPKKWFADSNMNDQTIDLIPEKWIRI